MEVFRVCVGFILVFIIGEFVVVVIVDFVVWIYGVVLILGDVGVWGCGYGVFFGMG